MSPSIKNDPVVRLQRLWEHLHRLPGGPWLFSRILARVIPYTGTIGADVREFKPGYAQITMRDRRRVRNHLNSVHALALANMGEFASGLAMLGALSTDTRGIPTRLTIEFYKKARGVLVAECHCSPPPANEDTDFDVHADIRDTVGDVVARTTVSWRLGPRPVVS
jgi:acyl-coenzyme A thioesterase PaaI-like protein